MNPTDLNRLFPRSSKYPVEWVKDGSMGSHVLWLTEWLCERCDLQPGMRVLDLGCGRAKSSVFLAKEFGVQVWATDLWVPATENWQSIQREGVADRVFPLHADARSLPFAAEFFDVILAVDCYSYFGTDDLYLNYLTQFVKQGGTMGMAGAGLVAEMSAPVPGHLSTFWTQDLWSLHSVDWWRRHWERTGLVEIVAADTMPDAWRLWSHWHRTAWPDNAVEIDAIEADAGRHLGYLRLVATRRAGMKLEEYVWPDTLRSLLKEMPPYVPPTTAANA